MPILCCNCKKPLGVDENHQGAHECKSCNQRNYVKGGKAVSLRIPVKKAHLAIALGLQKQGIDIDELVKTNPKAKQAIAKKIMTMLEPKPTQKEDKEGPVIIGSWIEKEKDNDCFESNQKILTFPENEDNQESNKSIGSGPGKILIKLSEKERILKAKHGMDQIDSAMQTCGIKIGVLEGHELRDREKKLKGCLQIMNENPVCCEAMEFHKLSELMSVVGGHPKTFAEMLNAKSLGILAKHGNQQHNFLSVVGQVGQVFMEKIEKCKSEGGGEEELKSCQNEQYDKLVAIAQSAEEEEILSHMLCLQLAGSAKHLREDQKFVDKKKNQKTQLFQILEKHCGKFNTLDEARCIIIIKLNESLEPMSKQLTAIKEKRGLGDMDPQGMNCIKILDQLLEICEFAFSPMLVDDPEKTKIQQGNLRDRLRQKFILLKSLGKPWIIVNEEKSEDTEKAQEEKDRILRLFELFKKKPQDPK